MWNQTPLLLQRAEGLPDRSGDGLLVGHPRRHRQRPRSCTRPPARRCLPSGFVLACGADARLARAARSDARLPRRVPRRRRSHTSSRCCASRTEGWRAWFDEEDVEPIEISYPVLWRNLTQIVGDRPRGARTGSAPGARTGAGAAGRSTLRRMGGPLPRGRGTGRFANLTFTSPERQRISGGTGRTSCRPDAPGMPRRASGSAPRGTAATVLRRAGSSPASVRSR